MKLSMDFSLIIAVLVLVQLYILNIKVNEDGNIKEKVQTQKVNAKVQEALSLEASQKGDCFVVHRGNGEIKIYSKKDVA